MSGEKLAGAQNTDRKKKEDVYMGTLAGSSDNSESESLHMSASVSRPNDDDNHDQDQEGGRSRLTNVEERQASLVLVETNRESCQALSNNSWEFASRGMHIDFTDHILDEIALEGLDEITPQGKKLSGAQNPDRKKNEDAYMSTLAGSSDNSDSESLHMSASVSRLNDDDNHDQEGGGSRLTNVEGRQASLVLVETNLESNQALSNNSWEFASRGRHIDITDHILDEIALEGLDGITPQALFERMKHRKELNNMVIDEPTKAYIWKFASRLKNIKIYIIPEARADLRLYDRLQYVDDRGNLYEPMTAPEDIYDYKPIDDKRSGIRGSCKYYYERRPFASTARKLTYEEIQARYYNRIVLVAPQHIRERSIIPSDIDIKNEELNIIQYCILERTARARDQGEITRGRVSLNTMKIDPKSLFYQRKLLLKKGLIKKQALSMKYGEMRTSSLVTLLHLPRFYYFVETTVLKAARATIKQMVESGLRMIECTALKAQFGKHIIKSFTTQDYSHIFEEQEQTAASMNPAILLMEPNADRREIMLKRRVKVLVLKHPGMDHTNFLQLMPIGDDRDEDDPEPQNSIFRFWRSPRKSILMKFIRHVYEAKVGGISLVDLADALNISALDARTGCRLLQRYKTVASVLEDRKKTKLNKYVYYKFSKANRTVQKVDTSKGATGTEQHPVVVDIEPEPLTTRTTTPPWVLVPSPDPDIIEVPSDSPPPQDEPLYLGTTTAQPKDKASKKTPKVKVGTKAKGKVPVPLSPQQLKSRRKKTGVPIPSGPTSVTPLKLGAGLVQLASSFVFKAKEQDLPCPPAHQDLRFSAGEDKDFNPMELPVKDSVAYETSGGWDVLVERAEVSARIGKNVVVFNSEKNVSRGNLILEMIYKQILILGFQQLLREIRNVESTLQKTFAEDPSSVKAVDVDRRSLFRILKQLQADKLIQVWRISVSRLKTKRIVGAFTPAAVVPESKLMMSATDLLIQALMNRVKLTREQKLAKSRKERLMKVKKPSKPRVPDMSEKLKVKITKTFEKAKKGGKKGNTTTRNLERFVALATTGTVPNQRRKRKKIKEPEPRQLYDDKDQVALSKLTKQRVEWDAEEDRYLLCLFIGSVLFIPRYNTNRIFMFNAPQIRDILHTKVPSSITKTSLAVRRRLHFLMRNNGFYCRYRYYLTEALADHTLAKEYLRKHQQREEERIFYQIPTPALIEVLDYLLAKFQTVKSADEENIFDLTFDLPVIVEDKKARQSAAKATHVVKERKNKSAGAPLIRYAFTNRASQQPWISILYETNYRHKATVSATDSASDQLSIDQWIARTSLLSLILSGDQKTNNVTTFLECLPDETLEQCITSLRKVGITSWSKRGRAFGISQAMKKKLQTHISPYKYRTGNHYLSQLRGNDEEESPLIHFFDSVGFENVGSFLMLCEMTSTDMVQFLIQLPDPIITINDDWKDIFEDICDDSPEEESGDAEDGSINKTSLLDESSASPRSRKRNRSRSPLSPNSVKRTRRTAEAAELPEFDRDTSSFYRCIRESPTNSPGGSPEKLSPSSSRSTSPDSSPIGSPPPNRTGGFQASSVLSNVVSGQTALQEALLARSTMANPAKTLRMSNKALRLMRSQINSLETASFVERDFFTVNLPKISVLFPGDVTCLDKIVYGGRRPTSDQAYLDAHLIRIVPYNYSSSTGKKTPSTKVPSGKFAVMYELIHLAGPVGLSIAFLLTKFDRELVREGIHLMVRDNIIFSVGIAHRRYVSAPNVTKWTMPVPKYSDSNIAMRVIMRPWIRSNGKMNWPLLVQFFASILGHLVLNPCLSVRDLCTNFRPIISPVEIYILVEAMVKMEFMKTFKMEMSHKVSLFSEPATIIRNSEVDMLLDIEYLHLELRPMATVKFSDLQELCCPAGSEMDHDVLENIVEKRIKEKTETRKGTD